MGNNSFPLAPFAWLAARHRRIKRPESETPAPGVPVALFRAKPPAWCRVPAASRALARRRRLPVPQSGGWTIPLAIWLGLALFVLAAGCGKKSPPKPPSKPASRAPAPPKKPRAQAPVAPAPKAPARTVQNIYEVSRLRDPFITLVGGAGLAMIRSEVVTADEGFSIHKLELKGILGRLALLVDGGSGASFILKSGRLIDAKGKQVKGVKGHVRKKSVLLMAGKKDTQVLCLGEKEKEREKE